MPTIKDKIAFNFDGVWSHELGLLHVVLDSNMYEETLVASREIQETKIRGNQRPLFHSIETSPLEFEMNIAFEGKFTNESLDKVIRWLFPKVYKPLYFEGKEDRVYMAMPINDSSIIHNGFSEGYVSITMRNNSSTLYSPTITTQKEIISESGIVTVFSDSHYDVYPEISLKKIGNGNITIESLDDNGNIFEIRDLTNMEDIYLDCDREIIETDLVGVYRYDKIIGDFPRILQGLNSINRFKISGDCEIQFRYRKLYDF